MISAKISVYAKNKEGETPFICALDMDIWRPPKLCSMQSRTPMPRTIVVIPLHYCAIHGHLDVAKALIKDKADVNAKDGDGWTLFT